MAGLAPGGGDLAPAPAQGEEQPTNTKAQAARLHNTSMGAAPAASWREEGKEAPHAVGQAAGDAGRRKG